MTMQRLTKYPLLIESLMKYTQCMCIRSLFCNITELCALV